MSSRFVSGGTILAGSDGSTRQLLPANGATAGGGVAAVSAGGGSSTVTPAVADLASATNPTVTLPSAAGAPPTVEAVQPSLQGPGEQDDEPPASAPATAEPSDPAALARQAEWAAVQASLDRERREREAARRALATGEGAEKTLYAILQENKAAKQAAFDEANSLRNQFLTLDDDDADFLAGVADSKRAAEERTKRELEEGLAAFRAAQRTGGGGGGDEGTVEVSGGDTTADGVVGGGEDVVSWENSGRKRKRVQDSAAKIGGLKGVKRKTSVPEGAGSATSSAAASSTEVAPRQSPTTTVVPGDAKSVVRASAPVAAAAAVPKAKASLVAYGSDEDEDD
ncbi:Fyv6-like protein [Microdochium nivale]|nr:Fyv6-like protein [Microdochium nivale]